MADDGGTMAGASFLVGGGEMGERIRAHDWASTPLGPAERWPQALRTALRILLTTQHPVFIFWGPGLHCFYNDAYRRSLGEEKHPAILGMRGREAWPEIWHIIGPQIEKVMRGDGSTWHENQLVPIWRNGRIEDVYWTYSYGPVDDETAPGGIGGVLVLTTETTALVRTAAALRDNEMRLQLALDVASLGVWEARIGTETVGADARIRELFDIDQDSSSVRDWFERIHPDDRHLVESRRQRARDEDDLYDVEYRIRTRAGERWVHARSRLLRDEQHGDRVLGVAEDVTTARRLREALEQSQRQALEQYERMKQMFEQAPGFICILRGPELRFEFANDAYVRAFGPRPLLGLTVREAFPELEDQGFFALLDRVYQGGERYVATGAAVRLDRGGQGLRDYVLDFIYEPMRDESGTVTGIFVEGQDVTERTRAEAAVREASRQKDEFLAMLAHELRNPMAPIRNAAEILARALPPDSPLLPVSGLLRRQAAQLSRLVDDLLDVSRITQGRIELKRRRIDLNAVIAQALETVEPLMKEKAHTLRSQTSSARLWVDADPERMVQALSNILANAAKYTDRGGRIHVLAHAAGDEAVVAVADNGIGIAEEMQPRIFDLFVQSERALDRAQGGLGIGLSVVKRLVEMHGGRVGVTSGGPGTGSTFEIRLPLQANPAQDVATTGLPDAPPCRILVVDDNRDAAESLAMLLQLEGHTVETAFDPRQALERAPLFLPDVVLLDIGMPEMDGFEVAHRMRALPQLARAFLVALTGYGRTEDRDMTAAAGFDAHLVKPVDLGALARVLAAVRCPAPPVD